LFYQELNPAIRSNLLLFKEKSKRISTSIGARAAVFKKRSGIKLQNKLKLSAFATLRD